MLLLLFTLCKVNSNRQQRFVSTICVRSTRVYGFGIPPKLGQMTSEVNYQPASWLMLPSLTCDNRASNTNSVYTCSNQSCRV